MFAHYDCIVDASVLHVDIPYCSDYKDACCEHPSLMFMVITVKIGFISSRLIENNYFLPIISTNLKLNAFLTPRFAVYLIIYVFQDNSKGEVHFGKD